MARQFLTITISILLFLYLQLSIAYSKQAQDIILFKHENELQFDKFVSWLRSVKNIKDANVLRRELASGLPFDSDSMTKEMSILPMKEVMGRFTIYKTCSYINLLVKLEKGLALISDLKQCASSTCSDKGVMDKLSDIGFYSEVLENFITQCKTHMNDIHEIQKVKLD